MLDPGSICEDGLTEAEVNAQIASLTVKYLEAAGMQVDLLEEWDPRLQGYHAVALVSIHADSCLPINEYATGFKVTAAVDTIVQDKAQRLVACIIDRYSAATDLYFHPGSITRDMTEYHTFHEINGQTPAVIIETGFLYLDPSRCFRKRSRLSSRAKTRKRGACADGRSSSNQRTNCPGSCWRNIRSLGRDWSAWRVRWRSTPRAGLPAR
ncbi:MAG: N-acetylmuramoyl-L-alanine amidase [Anaerolineales bacterium]